MENPAVGQRVRVRGQEQKVYLVVRVDEQSRTVDLAPAWGHGRGLDDVPFSDLLKAGEA